MSQHSDELIEPKPDVSAMSQQELMTEMANRCARISATNREILGFITPETKHETALHALVGLSCETIDAMVERIKAPSVDEAAKPAPGGPKMREGELGEPKRAFADTFSAGKVMKDAYFPEPTVPEVPARVDGEGE